MSAAQRTIPMPVVELDEEDRKRLAEVKARMAAGDPGIPQAEIMRMLDERRRAEKK